MAVLFLIQTIHILRTGEIAAFFIRSRTGSAASRRSAILRVIYALFYFIPAAAILGVLATAAGHSGPTLETLYSRVRSDLWPLLFGSLFAASGLWALLRPVGIVRWARHAYPQISETDEDVLLTARVVGAGLLLMSFPILTSL